VTTTRPTLPGLVFVLCGASALLLSACSSATAPEPSSPAVTAPTPTNTATQSADLTPEPTPTATQLETFAMPNLVGMNLRDAQDTLQSLNSYFINQEDARGFDRIQLLDFAWHVCAQEPAAGTVIDIAYITTLSSVKLEEVC